MRRLKLRHGRSKEEAPTAKKDNIIVLVILIDLSLSCSSTPAPPEDALHRPLTKAVESFCR